MSYRLLDKRCKISLNSFKLPRELMTNEERKRLKAISEIIKLRKTVDRIINNMINTVVAAEGKPTPKQIEEQRIIFICNQKVCI